MTQELTGEEFYRLLMLAQQREKLDSSEVAKLESEFESNTADLSLRVQLLTYYQHHDRSSQKCLQHLLWFIENNMEGAILEQVGLAWGKDEHIDELKRAWMKVIDSAPNKLIATKKAISFFKPCPTVANQFTELACNIDKDNAKWPHELSIRFLHEIRSLPVPRKETETTEEADARRESEEHAGKAFYFGKETLERLEKSSETIFRWNDFETFVNELAVACLRFNCLDEAKYFGNYLVEHAKKQQENQDKTENENNVAETALKSAYQTHLGHSIQSRAALQANDVELALTHLKQMPFFVSLDFEYDLLVAQALLEKGRKADVCAYLDDCLQNLTTTLEHAVPGDPVYERTLARCQFQNSKIEYPIKKTELIIDAVQDWITAIYAGEEVEFPTYLVKDFLIKDPDSQDWDLKKIEPREVPRFEKKLKKDPSDLKARILLLNYFQFKNDQKFLEHLFWLIENKPETNFKHYNIQVGGDQNDAVEAAWSQAIEKDPNNLTILRNAISCCGLLSKSTTQKWLEHGYKIDPSNEEWSRDLSFQYYLGTSDEPDEEARPDVLKSIQFGKEFLKRREQFGGEGKYSLSAQCEQNVKLCFRYGLLDDAQLFGEYLVEHSRAGQQAFSDNDTKFFWHISDEHQGHSILGRVALRRNDTEQMLDHLAKMPFYENIDFRIDLVFAQELLDAGKSEIALDYLDRCKRYFAVLLNLMLEEGEFCIKVWHTHDSPIDRPNYFVDGIRDKLASIEEWQTKIRAGKKFEMPERI
ncbi:MAG: hypothetical protein JST89_00360 [Cyanobacteria bacterium SZAS-4]|nr:hypothetical protein [Cyanobacteria bacterium SZAS-4]